MQEKGKQDQTEGIPVTVELTFVQDLLWQFETKMMAAEGSNSYLTDVERLIYQSQREPHPAPKLTSTILSTIYAKM